jgi:hypothetical protein
MFALDGAAHAGYGRQFAFRVGLNKILRRQIPPPRLKGKRSNVVASDVTLIPYPGQPQADFVLLQPRFSRDPARVERGTGQPPGTNHPESQWTMEKPSPRRALSFVVADW